MGTLTSSESDREGVVVLSFVCLQRCIEFVLFKERNKLEKPTQDINCPCRAVHAFPARLATYASHAYYQGKFLHPPFRCLQAGAAKCTVAVVRQENPRSFVSVYPAATSGQ